MNRIPLAMLASCVSTSALAQTVNFDNDQVGSPPAGWTCGVTGSGRFLWCVKSGTALADGFGEVKFKPISGRETRNLAADPEMLSTARRCTTRCLRDARQRQRKRS